MRQSWETMTSVSAGHIILTPIQPVGSGWPQRELSPGPPHQELRAPPTELPRPPHEAQNILKKKKKGQKKVVPLPNLIYKHFHCLLRLRCPLAHDSKDVRYTGGRVLHQLPASWTQRVKEGQLQTGTVRTEGRVHTRVNHGAAGLHRGLTAVAAHSIACHVTQGCGV